MEKLKSEQPAGKPFGSHNRAQRRRIAKKAGLFKDKSGDAWRTVNKSIKNREAQKNGNAR